MKSIVDPLTLGDTPSGNGRLEALRTSMTETAWCRAWYTEPEA